MIDNRVKRQRTVGFIMSYLFIGINTIVGFILNPLMINFMGDVDFGVYQTVATFSNYLLIINFGLGTVITRYVSLYVAQKNEESKQNFLFLSLIITGVFSIVIILAAIFLYTQIDVIYQNTLSLEQLKQVNNMFPILASNVVLSLIAQSVQGIILGYEKFIYNSFCNILRILLRICTIYVALKCGYSGIGVAVAEMITTIIYLLLFVCYAIVKLKVRCKFYYWDKILISEIVTFSLALLLQCFINQMNSLIGKFFVSVMVGPKQVAIYTNVMTIVTMFSSISTAAVSIFLPQATQLVAQKATMEELTDFTIRPCRVQVALSGAVLCGFILFGRQFVSLWLGDKYLSVWILAIIIMIPSFFFYANSVIVSVLDALRKRLVRSIIMLVTLGGNIILCVMLIPHLGTYGAAISTAISVFLGQVVVMNIYYYRGVRINIIKQFKESFKGTALCLVLSSILCIPLAIFNSKVSFISFLFNVVIFVLIFIVLMVRFGLGENEKNILRKIVKVRGNKKDD